MEQIQICHCKIRKAQTQPLPLAPVAYAFARFDSKRVAMPPFAALWALPLAQKHHVTGTMSKNR